MIKFAAPPSRKATEGKQRKTWNPPERLQSGRLLIFAPASFVKTSDGQGFFFARPPIPSRAVRGEDSPEAEQARSGVKIPFELFLEYTAKTVKI